MSQISETHTFLRKIGKLSCVLWLAKSLKHETEMLRPLPYCDVHWS